MNIFQAIKLWQNINTLKGVIKEVGMLKFLEGYRTYLTLIVMIFHQVLKLAGLDPIEDEKLTTAVDVFLAILAAIFRKLAKPKP